MELDCQYIYINLDKWNQDLSRTFFLNRQLDMDILLAQITHANIVAFV